jgi:hypothetical protein
MFSLQQNWRRGQNRFCLEAKGMGGRRRGGVCVCVGKMAETVYAHMNKVNKQFLKRLIFSIGGSHL